MNKHSGLVLVIIDEYPYRLSNTRLIFDETFWSLLNNNLDFVHSDDPHFKPKVQIFKDLEMLQDIFNSKRLIMAFVTF